ncbi:hypothetical protein [Desulforhabdus sp. TSK]|uniref:hypothetical protein n=1 Tax=Desulforhabdus sp. TSK TaxID=2925014 RepID=UPI001FC8A671|nr:hypothetical protein [Desulforhabdus sp. TSK]
MQNINNVKNSLLNRAILFSSQKRLLQNTHPFYCLTHEATPVPRRNVSVILDLFREIGIPGIPFGGMSMQHRGGAPWRKEQDGGQLKRTVARETNRIWHDRAPRHKVPRYRAGRWLSYAFCAAEYDSCTLRIGAEQSALDPAARWKVEERMLKLSHSQEGTADPELSVAAGLSTLPN